MTKRVLVTGAAGFIGHHLVEYLIEKTGWDIICLDKLNYSGNLNRLNDVLSKYDNETLSRVKIVYHDLRAEIGETTSHLIGDVNYILHLAASSHVDRSIKYPDEFVLDNVVGTLNILQFARNHLGLERFIYFSTDEVFGSAPEGVEFKEYDRYNAGNPYSASKAAGEELCTAFHNTYNMPIYVTHTMNVFGERQNPEKFIPSCIRKVRNDESMPMYVDSELQVSASRHYVHAKDVADAINFILRLDPMHIKTDGYAGVKIPKFNIVSHEEYNNMDVATMIAKSIGTNLKWHPVPNMRPGHDTRYSLSGEYMKSLGWVSKISFKDRIHDMVQWSLKNDKWLK